MSMSVTAAALPRRGSGRNTGGQRARALQARFRRRARLGTWDPAALSLCPVGGLALSRGFERLTGVHDHGSPPVPSTQNFHIPHSAKPHPGHLYKQPPCAWRVGEGLRVYSIPPASRTQPSLPGEVKPSRSILQARPAEEKGPEQLEHD